MRRRTPDAARNSWVVSKKIRDTLRSPDSGKPDLSAYSAQLSSGDLFLTAAEVLHDAAVEAWFQYS